MTETLPSEDDGRPFANHDADVTETTYVHDDDEYCARQTDGRVIVGVTNAAGEVLLLVNEEQSHAILPNCHVEDGDWAGVARRTVEESTSVLVTLDGPKGVRVVDHRIEGQEDPRERTYHVIFGGRPIDTARGREPTCDDPDWNAGWYAEVPFDLDGEAGDVLDDIERFLD